jgi:hypothetical protein
VTQRKKHDSMVLLVPMLGVLVFVILFAEIILAPPGR